MTNLRLRLIGGDYDRTRPLIDGQVKPEGIELEWVHFSAESTWQRFLSDESLDVAEVALPAAFIARGKGSPPLVPLPIFPSRYFRHSLIFINADSGIERPQDLVGRRVGVAKYTTLALAAWLRGMLQDEYGVAPNQITWVTTEQGRPGLPDRLEAPLPADLSIESAPAGASLDELLDRGEIDAHFTAHRPESFQRGVPRIRRLFPNYRAVEQDYCRRTGLFPVMHIMVVREEVFRRNPWIGASLCEAFEEAKRRCYRRNEDLGPDSHSLAWFLSYLEEERQVLGADPWAFGVEPNPHLLETFARYCHEQGLTARRLSPDELFAEVYWSPEPTGTQAPLRA